MRKLIQKIFVVLMMLSVVSITTMNAQNNNEKFEDKSMQHKLVAYNKEVEVGNDARFELAISNSYNPEFKKSTLIIEMPEWLNGGSVNLTSTMESLRINNVLPRLENQKIIYEFENIENAFSESVVLTFNSKNGSNLNDKSLDLVSTLTQDDNSVTEVSSTIFKSSWNLTGVNELFGTKKELSDDINPNKNLILDQYAVFALAISSDKLESGTLGVDLDSNVLLTLELPKGATYVSDTLGVTPNIDSSDNSKQIITWNVDFSDTETKTKYLNKDFNVTIIMDNKDDSLKAFDEYTVNFESSVKFIDGSTQKTIATSTSMITQEEGSNPPPTHGSRILPRFFGPIDGKGNVGKQGVQNDTTVTDSATLAWVLAPTPQSATHPYEGFESYDVFFIPSEGNVIDTFYTGDYFLRANASYEMTDLHSDVFMSFSVLYDGESEWTHLKEALNVSTLYTADDLGIDSSRTVKMVWLAYHDNTETAEKFPSSIGYKNLGDKSRGLIPGGLTTYSMKFTTSVESGFVGSLSGKFAQAVSGLNYQNNSLSHYTPFLQEFLDNGSLKADSKMTVSPNIDGYIPEMKVDVIKPTEGDSRVIQAKINYLNSDDGLLDSGDNTLQVSIMSDETSVRAITGPFEVKVLLPEGVNYNESIELMDANLISKDLNYKDTMATLLTLQFKNTASLSAGKVRGMNIPVTIDEKAPYNLETVLVGYLTDDFVVSEHPNDVGYITEKVQDPYDEDNTKDVYRITNVSTYKFAYSHYLKASVLNEENNKYENNTNIALGDLIKTRLSIINNYETASKDIELVYSIPKANDKYMLNNADRGSSVDLKLNEFVDLNDLENILEVLYSTEEDFNLENSDWKEMKDIESVEDITALKVINKKGIAAIRDKEISIDLELKVVNPNTALDSRAVKNMAVQTFVAKVDENPMIESAPSRISVKNDVEVDPKPEKPQPEKPQPEKPQPEKPQPEKPQPEKPQPEKPQVEDPKEETPKTDLNNDNSNGSVNTGIYNSQSLMLTVYVVSTLALLILAIKKKKSIQ